MMTKDEKNAYMRSWNAKNRVKVRAQKNAMYATLSPEQKTALARKQMGNPPEVEAKRVTTKKYMLSHAYGLSLEQYARMKESQGNKCSVCSRELIERGKDRKVPVYLCVDHNHTTGKVRGLLCSNCNAGIGMFEENKSRMVRAIEYLRENDIG